MFITNEDGHFQQSTIEIRIQHEKIRKETLGVSLPFEKATGTLLAPRLRTSSPTWEYSFEYSDRRGLEPTPLRNERLFPTRTEIDLGLTLGPCPMP